MVVPRPTIKASKTVLTITLAASLCPVVPAMANEVAPQPEDDPQLAEKIIEDELPCVARWMLDGLKRLKRNGWKFTTSEKQRTQEQRYREDSFNLLAFLKDADWVTFDRNGSVTSREMYAGYQQWCSVNGEETLAQRTVSNYLKSNSKQLNIRATNSIANRDGIRSRGF